MLNLITVHAHLVTSDNSFEAVLFTEFLGDVGSELHTNASLARSSSRLVLGISPQHLHHQARLAGLSLVVSVQFADVVQSNAIIGEETTVKNQILLANKGSQCQCRETFGEKLEDPACVCGQLRILNLFSQSHSFPIPCSPLVVLCLAFTLESIYSVHVVCLVVASVQEETVGSQPFVGVQE